MVYMVDARGVRYSHTIQMSCKTSVRGSPDIHRAIFCGAVSGGGGKSADSLRGPGLPSMPAAANHFLTCDAAHPLSAFTFMQEVYAEVCRRWSIRMAVRFMVGRQEREPVAWERMEASARYG